MTSSASHPSTATRGTRKASSNCATRATAVSKSAWSSSSSFSRVDLYSAYRSVRKESPASFTHASRSGFQRSRSRRRKLTTPQAAEVFSPAEVRSGRVIIAKKAR